VDVIFKWLRKKKRGPVLVFQDPRIGMEMARRIWAQRLKGK
jgi:hypothetical protein